MLSQVPRNIAGSDYDQLPYLSLPIAYTLPSRLAALVRLHGASDCAPPEQARVLELGCANGGNLMPMAARWPASAFTGVDLSERQIEEGIQRCRYFGLGNVTLIQGDVSRISLAAKAFDYVICHGLFSWVPVALQQDIFRLAEHCLSDRGVAAISYNTLPGWHLRSPIRDLLRYHAGTSGGAAERVERARAALAHFETMSGGGRYGALLHAEAKLLAKAPSSYIHGEFLTEHNHPILFSDFAAAAASHGLAVVCEADLDAGALSGVPSEAKREWDMLAARDPMRASQELDFASGRPFRRTLLRRRSAVRTEPPSAERLAGLHLSADLQPKSDPVGSLVTFLDRFGRQVSTGVPEIAAAFIALGRAYPATMAVDELLAAAGSARARTAEALLSLVASDRAVVSVAPLTVGSAADPRPSTWRHARAEAALGLPGVTSLQHVTVALSKPAVWVAAHADGTRTPSELAAGLAAAVAAGKVEMPKSPHGGAAGVMGKAEITAYCEQQVAEAVRVLARGGVLAPAG